MSTITQLQAELEELEKRVKALTTAQNSLTMLNQISEYFAKVQQYLNDLQTTYENHIVDCNQYSTQITELQSQITTLSNKVDSLADTSEYDLSEMSTNLQSLQNELSNLKGESTSSLLDLETSIESLQGEHDNMQEDIDTNTNDISTINETISSMQTTITNLTTTQNSLSSTQSNLTSTVSGINSRLSTAEANISTLTEGVDVSELDDRITQTEQNTGPVFFYKKICNPTAKVFDTWNSEIMHFYCKINSPILIKVKIKYEVPTSATTLTFNHKINSNIPNPKTIDLTTNPNEYEDTTVYLTSYYSNTYQVTISNISDITINEVEVTIMGSNINPCEYVKDITAYAYNGYIYLTRHYDTYIKYGKFLPTDEIDIDNLPNTQSLTLNDISYNRLIFMPFPFAVDYADGNKYVEYVSDVFYGESTRGMLETTKLSSDDDNDLGYLTLINYQYSTEPALGILSKPIKLHINGDRTTCQIHQQGQSNYYLNTSSGQMCTPGAYGCVFPARKNCGKIGDRTTTTDYVLYVAKSMQDGYFYLFRGFNNYPANIKLGKGDFATAFIQEDDSINVYISNSRTTHKYNVSYTITGQYFTTTFTVTDMGEIDKCGRLYELIEDKVLIYRPQTITVPAYWELTTQ